MYRDATELAPDTIVTGYDLCIAGAGAAGIAMAQRLIGSSKKVLLLVNGLRTDTGDKPKGPLQQIYVGTLSCYSMRKYCTWPPRRISAS